jgi:hypothetical protein
MIDLYVSFNSLIAIKLNIKYSMKVLERKICAFFSVKFVLKCFFKTDPQKHKIENYAQVF